MKKEMPLKEENELKVALYARVSKEDLRIGKDDGSTKVEIKSFQDPENQLEPMRKMCELHKWKIQKEYVDKKSGGILNRPALQQMLQDAKNEKFDMIVVWALDRLSRGGIVVTSELINNLKSEGVAIKSVQESWLDTRKENSISDLILAIFAWVAEQERLRISMRIKAALQKKREVDGFKMGRAPFGFKYNTTTKQWDVDKTQMKIVQKFMEDLAEGKKPKDVAKAYGFSKRTLKALVFNKIFDKGYIDDLTLSKARINIENSKGKFKTHARTN